MPVKIHGLESETFYLGGGGDLWTEEGWCICGQTIVDYTSLQGLINKYHSTLRFFFTQVEFVLNLNSLIQETL